MSRQIAKPKPYGGSHFSYIRKWLLLASIDAAEPDIAVAMAEWAIAHNVTSLEQWAGLIKPYLVLEEKSNVKDDQVAVPVSDTETGASQGPSPPAPAAPRDPGRPVVLGVRSVGPPVASPPAERKPVTVKDIDARLGGSYEGSDNTYRLTLDGVELFRSHKIKDENMFRAQLLVWVAMNGG